MKRTLSSVAAVLLTLSGTTVAAASVRISVQAGGYETRSGAAEARSDLQQHRPLKLYSHVYNGRGPGFRTPGLLSCNPTWTDRLTFILMDEAYWQEGQMYSAAHDRSAEAAIRFAADYNRTIFRAQGDLVAEACPDVKEAG